MQPLKALTGPILMAVTIYRFKVKRCARGAQKKGWYDSPEKNVMQLSNIFGGEVKKQMD